MDAASALVKRNQTFSSPSMLKTTNSTLESVTLANVAIKQNHKKKSMTVCCESSHVCSLMKRRETIESNNINHFLD